MSFTSCSPRQQLLGKQSLQHCIVTVLVSLLMLATWQIAHASTQTYIFKTPEEERLFHELTSELRCPTCQNNNIAESNAGISMSMRNVVYELLQKGYTKQEVVDHMVERYGDFITYDPPVRFSTIILWAAPATALLIGLVVIVYRARKNTAVKTQPPQETQEPTSTESNSANPNPTLDKTLEEPEKKVSKAFIAFCGVLLLIFTAGVFYSTTNWDHVNAQRAAHASYQTLRTRAIANDNLTAMEMQQLILGLQQELQRNPQSAEDWMLLTIAYLNLQAYTEAIQSAGRAYALKPDDSNIQGTYGQLLMMTGDPVNIQEGVNLLEAVLSKDPKNRDALATLAFYEYSNNNYSRAITLWQSLLELLPAGSPDAELIRRTIDKVQSEHAQLSSTST